MLPCFTLAQVYTRLQYTLACLALCFLLRQPSAAGIAIDATGFLLLSPPFLRGNLSSNNVLQTAERLHVGRISVPHSSVVIGDDVFSATSSGLIFNVAPCRPVVIANLRPRGCRTLQECGHLISIRKSADNSLIVLDAYRGVFEVHPVTGVTRKLFDSRAFVNGRPCLYLNDLVIMEDGTIILSDSSPRFDYAHEFWIRFEGRPDGRLIGLSLTTGRSKEILSGLAYPTGLEISTNGQALLVSEASRARILRLDLRKDRFFQKSYVNINLPGMPEHIRRTGRGTYWVALSYPRFRGEPSPLDQYSNKAASRNIIAARGTMYEIQQMFKKRGLAVEVDDSGKILRSIHDPSGLKVSEALEVTEFNGILYVGTRFQQATVRVVGAPSELNVDSVVQVLRSRCKVPDDKIQEAKQSIALQLHGNTTRKPQDEKSKFHTQVPQTTPPSSNVQASKVETPQRSVNLHSLTQGLSKLHKVLLNVTAPISKVTQPVNPADSTSQQEQNLLASPTEQIIPTQQPGVTVHQYTVVSPVSSSTQSPVEDHRVLLVSSGIQRIEGMLNVQFSHNSVSPPTVSPLPNVVYHIQDQRLHTQAAISQPPQETSLGSQSVQPQGTYTQQLSQPVQPQGTYTQHLSQPVQPQGTYTQQLSQPVQPQGTYTQQLSQPGQSQGTYTQQLSQPVQPQGTYTQQLSQPVQPQGTYTQQLSQPVQPSGTDSQQPGATFIRYSSELQEDNSTPKPQEYFTGYPSQPQQGTHNQTPQETSAGYSSGQQQDAFGQKSQETSIGYSPTLKDVLGHKPQENFTGYQPQPQQGENNQKPQQPSGYSSTLQDVNVQKPQENVTGYALQPKEVNNQNALGTSMGYSSTLQQDVPGQKPHESVTGFHSPSQPGVNHQNTQESVTGYHSPPQQGVNIQKPHESVTGYHSPPQQGVNNQNPQETVTGYHSPPQQGMYNQKPQEISGYSSKLQQDVTGQTPHESVTGYHSQLQQGMYNQKPQETSLYSSKMQQDVTGQNAGEMPTGYESQPMRDAHNQKSQEAPIGYPSQRKPLGQKPRDAFVLGPQRGIFNQKPETNTGSQQGFLSHKSQESFIGYPQVPHHGEGSFTETSNYPVHVPIKQQLLAVTSTQRPIEMIPEIVTESPSEVTTGIGGFMGFMGELATEKPASNNGYYNFQQDFGSMSDPGMYGQIEPGININPGASERKHQFLPGMDPVLNFEQMSIPNDQTQNTEQEPLLSLSRTKRPNSAPETAVNSFQPGSPKRSDMNVQDISMKGAVEIQNMQMFHPTDRPELIVKPQNQAIAKAETTIQEKAQPFAIEMQQLDGISFIHGANEEFANSPGNQFQSQRPQVQEIPRNSQHINTVGHGRVSSATAGGIDRAISHAGSIHPQIELVDPSTPLHQSFSNGSF